MLMLMELCVVMVTGLNIDTLKIDQTNKRSFKKKLFCVEKRAKNMFVFCAFVALSLGQVLATSSDAVQSYQYTPLNLDASVLSVRENFAISRNGQAFSVQMSPQNHVLYTYNDITGGALKTVTSLSSAEDLGKSFPSVNGDALASYNPASQTLYFNSSVEVQNSLITSIPADIIDFRLECATILKNTSASKILIATDEFLVAISYQESSGGIKLQVYHLQYVKTSPFAPKILESKVFDIGGIEMFSVAWSGNAFAYIPSDQTNYPCLTSKSGCDAKVGTQIAIYILNRSSGQFTSSNTTVPLGSVVSFFKFVDADVRLISSVGDFNLIIGTNSCGLAVVEILNNSTLSIAVEFLSSWPDFGYQLNSQYAYSVFGPTVVVLDTQGLPDQSSPFYTFEPANNRFTTNVAATQGIGNWLRVQASTGTFALTSATFVVGLLYPLSVDQGMTQTQLQFEIEFVDLNSTK